MTQAEYDKGITRKPPHIEHTVGEVCKPMEKGVGTAIGVSNRIRIMEVIYKQRSTVIHFEHV